MKKLLIIGLTLCLSVISACSVCANEENVGIKEGKERAMLSEGNEHETTAQKREFKSKHGVSSLIQQRLQNK